MDSGSTLSASDKYETWSETHSVMGVPSTTGSVLTPSETSDTSSPATETQEDEATLRAHLQALEKKLFGNMPEGSNSQDSPELRTRAREAEATPLIGRFPSDIYEASKDPRKFFEDLKKDRDNEIAEVNWVFQNVDNAGLTVEQVYLIFKPIIFPGTTEHDLEKKRRGDNARRCSALNVAEGGQPSHNVKPQVQTEEKCEGLQQPHGQAMPRGMIDERSVELWTPEAVGQSFWTRSLDPSVLPRFGSIRGLVKETRMQFLVDAFALWLKVPKHVRLMIAYICETLETGANL